MALIGQGVLIIWHAMTPEGDLEMIRWHDREHVAERVGIPGAVVAELSSGAGSGAAGATTLPPGPASISTSTRPTARRRSEARRTSCGSTFRPSGRSASFRISGTPCASAARPCSPRAAVRAARS